MDKKNIKIPTRASEIFPGLKSYSADEIFATGGTTAFADKLGKKPETIDERLSKLPKDAFLTDADVEKALKILADCK
jgi:hypothetical protein